MANPLGVVITATYQLLSDLPGSVWVELVLGEAKAEGLITDYEVVGVRQPEFTEHVEFSVTVTMSRRWTGTADEVMAKANDFVNELVCDSDVIVGSVSLP